MIFNCDLRLIIWWGVLIQVNLIWGGRDDDHVHIKVHVPQVYKKHYHHRTVAKHHFHHPKKSHHLQHHNIHHDVLSTNIEPEIEYPLLSAQAVSKYVKWQDKQNSPLTWYSDSPTGFTIEKPKYVKPPSLRKEKDEYNLSSKKNYQYNYDTSDVDVFNKFSSPSISSINPMKDFRIHIENDSMNKYPIQHHQYSSYTADDQDQDQRDEYTEEDTDSYMENTEALALPSALPYSAQSMMVVSNDDDYYDSSSMTMPTAVDESYHSSYNSNWKPNGKRSNSNVKIKNHHKRPPSYRDDPPIKMYGENSWMSYIQPEQYNEWTPNSYGKTSDFNKSKKNGRKPTGPSGPINSSGHGMNFNTNNNNNNNNNYESYMDNEYGPDTINEYRVRNKRPRRKSKPKWNRYLQNGSGFKF